MSEAALGTTVDNGTVGRIIHSGIGIRANSQRFENPPDFRERVSISASRPVALEVQQLLRFCSVFSGIEQGSAKELLRFEARTGLTGERLIDLAELVHERCADAFVSRCDPSR